MLELFFLYIVCRNIGQNVRRRGVRARPYQIRAVVLWFVFEILGGILGALITDGETAGIYAFGFLGALCSLPLSFKHARSAYPNHHRPLQPNPAIPK